MDYTRSGDVQMSICTLKQNRTGQVTGTKLKCRCNYILGKDHHVYIIMIL